MPRINIEDSLFKDSRFIDLCIHHKDKQKALGILVWAFIIAQKHYLDELSDRLIPLSEWKRQGCDESLITLGFAEFRENGVYLCGSEKQFGWLVQRVEAGRIGGKSIKTKEKKEIKQNKRSLNETKRSLSEPKPLTLSLTHSLTQTHSSNNNTAEKIENSETLKDPNNHHHQFFSLKEIWNSNCGILPKCVAVNESRKRAERARLKENPSREYWESVVRRMAASSFCTGGAPPRPGSNKPFMADFDFYIQPNTHIKVMEGKYDDKINKGSKIESSWLKQAIEKEEKK